MAHIVTNRGLYLLGKDDASAMDIRMAVFTGTVPAAATIRDWNFLSEVIASALNEATVANYARMDLAGVTLTEVDGSDTATLTATAPTINNVGAGETFTCVAFYKFNASDAAAEVLSVDEPAAPIITNGGNITFPALSLTVVQG
jgi:hypothetical protein